MKKIKERTLSPRQAYEKFVPYDKENPTDPQSKELLVTLTLPTHRISPDYKKDALELKNLVVQAEKELLQQMEKKKVPAYMESIKKAQEWVDHSHNLAGMVLYADGNTCNVVKLPVSLNPEVIIGPYYDIRPLLRARQQVNNYYILTISRQKIRLLEALNDRILMEFEDEYFPWENVSYYTDNPIELAQDDFTERLIQEFFNTADKNFRPYLLANPLPVVLAGDIKNISRYRKIMDNDCTVIGSVYGNYDHTPCHELVKETWPIIQKYMQESEEECTSYIEQARSAGLLTTDINEIFKMAEEGNADTLYLGNDLSLKGDKIDKDPDLSQREGEEPLVELVHLIHEKGGTLIFWTIICCKKISREWHW
ncbi:MAG: hypothetical protein LUE93_14505 [Bacteroides sp.]|nr:hypothetical protein [Bacteroides sp.]